MGKRRAQIPESVADQIMFDSDLLCCVCQQQGHHIHHINGYPSNNDPDNLILLCFEHHNQSSVTNNIARKLSQGALRRYREHWYKRVEEKRNDEKITKSESHHHAMVDAVAVIEVRKLGRDIRECELEDVLDPLSRLYIFSDRNCPHARYEILEVVELLSTTTRNRMPREVARQVSSIAYEALSIQSLVRPTEIPFSMEDLEFFEYGLSTGQNLIHDGDKYLDDLRVVEYGAELLWKILRYARINSYSKLIESAIRTFDWVSGGDRSKDADRLIGIYRVHGETGDHRFPDYPDDLVDKILSPD